MSSEVFPTWVTTCTLSFKLSNLHPMLLPLETTSASLKEDVSPLLPLVSCKLKSLWFSRMQTKVYQISPLFPKLFLFILLLG